MLEEVVTNCDCDVAKTIHAKSHYIFQLQSKPHGWLQPRLIIPKNTRLYANLPYQCINIHFIPLHIHKPRYWLGYFVCFSDDFFFSTSRHFVPNKTLQSIMDIFANHFIWCRHLQKNIFTLTKEDLVTTSSIPKI